MPDRIRVTVRDARLYVDADDAAQSLRHRAAAYRTRAEQLVGDAATPDPAAVAGIVSPLDEALACRMVAEELEQRADVLDALGG